MKTWFDSGWRGKLKRIGSRKGTLSEALNKTDPIGKQLKYKEDDLSKEEKEEKQIKVKHELPQIPQAFSSYTKPDDLSNKPWQRQILKPEHTIKYVFEEDYSCNQEIAKKPELTCNIMINFSEEDTILLTKNISHMMRLLNNSGEQFDFKMTNDGIGGQNLNVIAPMYLTRQILGLFK